MDRLWSRSCLNLRRNCKKLTKTTRHMLCLTDLVSSSVTYNSIAVFKWATNGPKVVTDPLETSEVRIFTVTWNM